MKKITPDDIQYHLKPKELEWFRSHIPSNGLTALEWIRLPFSSNDAILSKGEIARHKLLALAEIKSTLPDLIYDQVALFAARDVLPYYEQVYPGDRRPREAIEAKEEWLAGRLSQKELKIAALRSAYAAEETDNWAGLAAQSAADAADADSFQAMRRSIYSAAACYKYFHRDSGDNSDLMSENCLNYMEELLVSGVGSQM